MVATGSKARLAYGLESTFKGGGTADKAFGVGQRLTGIRGRNTIERIYEIGSRVANKLIAGRFDGAWGVEAILGNKDVFQTISSTNPVSLVIEVGFEGTNKVLRTLKGAVVRRMSISTRTNEPVRLRIDGLYATESVSNPTSITPVVDDTQPYTFAGATLTFDNQAVANVMAFDVDIDTGFEYVFALGARTARDLYGRMYEIGGRFSAVALTEDFVKYLYGLGTKPTEPVESTAVQELSMVATFSNGTDTTTITLGGVVIDELGSAIEANELILFDVSFIARTVTIS